MCLWKVIPLFVVFVLELFFAGDDVIEVDYELKRYVVVISCFASCFALHSCCEPILEYFLVTGKISIYPVHRDRAP